MTFIVLKRIALQNTSENTCLYMKYQSYDIKSEEYIKHLSRCLHFVVYIEERSFSALYRGNYYNNFYNSISACLNVL